MCQQSWAALELCIGNIQFTMKKDNESGGKLESQKEYGAKLSVLGKKRSTLYF